MNKTENRKYSKIAWRFRILNAIFLTIILIIVSVVSFFMLLGISDNSSKANARFYSVEVADILGSRLGREISFMQYASQSKEVLDWFSDENNPEKKAAAYQRMINYTDFLSINSLYFVIHGSLNEYSIDKDALFSDFIPFNIIDESNIYDQWYFNCVNSENDFSLNMDVDKITNTRRLWINYKVIENGEIKGVFCSALQFDDIFYELFSHYDSTNVTGYIIDHEGFIKMDSSESDPFFLYVDSEYGEIEDRINITDKYPNEEIISSIITYLNKSNIPYSSLRVEPDIIKLQSGNFRYMSIAPIPNTNWSTVTLYSARSLFNIGQFLPPFLVIFSAFILYALATSALVRRFLLKPLNKLTGSVSKADLKENLIFGIERDDEIGELARATRDTWKDLSQKNERLSITMNEAEQRDKLLQTANIVATILLDSDISKFERNLYRCMGMMAATVDADRVYIWKNSFHRGELCATQIYEWSERTEPMQGNEYTINISYLEKMPEWGRSLAAGLCINSLTRDMSDQWEMLSANGVLSIFLAPVFLQDEFWGFVGFDNCHKEIKFSENEEAILRSGCLLIANAFLRHNNISEIVRLQENLEESLVQAHSASRAKSSFLAHMSHEIRTPMNSIIGFSELAKDDDISEKTDEYLSKIIENAKWLLQIINDVLDISKIESGKMELEKIPFDIYEMFDNCKTLIIPKTNEKGIELYYYAEPSKGIKPLGDPTRLRQVLINLLSNAVKFTSKGTINVMSSIKSRSDENITMYFEVKDSGIGMTEEQIEKIFDPFTQAESGTMRQYGGTGLGLSITKNIVELMGGTL
ncbi:MAG: ATP-binding protein, partial [Treponema sp.]|nr:ATP-binding protein [Treponema sp.]